MSTACSRRASPSTASRVRLHGRLLLGFSRSDGFFLDDGPGGALLELYAGISAAGIDGSVDIFGVPLASVENGAR